MFTKGGARRGASIAVFQTAFAVLSLAGFLVLHFTASAAPDIAAVWVADQKRLKRVDPDVNQYVQGITLANAAEGDRLR